MSQFVHLHNHTDYSLLDGAAKISKYVEKAKEFGMTSLAITDHGNMFGALRFYRACKAADINPIVGCEFYVNPESHRQRGTVAGGSRNYHLVLLAMNEKGYHNLMELNSIAYTEGYYYKPRIDDQLITEHQEGLICLSACLAGEISQLVLNEQYDRALERVNWFKSVFDDGRYYIEVQDHGLPEQHRINPILKRLSEQTGVPLVATNDIHYINQDDANAQDILLCIGTNSKKNDADRMRFPTQEFYMKSPQQMEELFSWCPEAVENTARIAQRCNLEIHFPGPLLPIFEVPEGFDDTSDYLRHLASEGLIRRYGEATPELTQRLDYELDTIIKMDFQGYFLIVRDYIYWAKTHGIPVGPGRGSGAGSLVAYCIDITDVDPIKYNLLFERFLNPERVSMPDFDIDFCFERRQEVIDYVTEHYGIERVAQIATFGTLKAKAVVKDVARVLDIPFDESNQICKLIPDDPKMTLDKAMEMSPELKEKAESGGIYGELFDVAKRIEGMNRHTSTHAAGVVIGKEALINYVPLYRDPKTGAISTQYTMDLIEDCGLVKMDFLGLKTLTLIKHTVDLIRKREPDFDIEKISDTDGPTFKMLCDGESACVFQFESPGMQRILRDAQPSSIEDLVALNALYRPGPMAYIPQFVECKHGRKPITYADPDLEDELKTTYGVIVYQEQVMKVAQIIAGYTLGGADILRRIMGKKKKDKLAEEKVKFIAGAKKLGRDPKHAAEIFEMLEPFAGYGFNKSHAVAYSVVAYQTAFLKANYPAEFMAANLTNEINNPDKFTEYLLKAKDMGLEILPPTINFSDKHFNVVDGKIVYGLAGIKNVGEGVVELIVKEREEHGPYKDFMDFLMRVDAKAINSKLLESLIHAGAFDALGTNRPTLINNLEAAVKFVQKRREAQAYGQCSLFDAEEEAAMDVFDMVPAPDFGIMEKLEKEKSLLGFYISGHPLDLYKDAFKRCVTVDIGHTDRLPKNRTCALIAMVTSLREFITQKGSKMAFLALTDFNGTIDATVFPKTWERIGPQIQVDGIYGFKGKFDNNRDPEKYSFLIDEVVDPNSLEPEAVREAHISLQKEMCTPVALRELMDLCLSYQGSCSMLLHVSESFQSQDPAPSADEDPSKPQETLQEIQKECAIVQAGREFSVRYSEDFLEELRRLPLVRSAWYN
ncbi:MAG: DNA polymerase III subunit alpha [Sphaerochaetaceae bacterium]